MEKEIIYEGDGIILWLYPQEGILHHRMLKPIESRVFKEFLLEGIKVIKEGKATKWLSNDFLGGQISPDDEGWTEKLLAGRVHEAGWRYWAVILPEGARAKITTTRLVNQHSVLTSQIFENEEEALEWLISCGE